MSMMLVARALERIGDNAVDIGEQVAFVVTGQFREFSDASHAMVTSSAVVPRPGGSGFRVVTRSLPDGLALVAKPLARVICRRDDDVDR